jgi:hypothetical protein
MIAKEKSKNKKPYILRSLHTDPPNNKRKSPQKQPPSHKILPLFTSIIKLKEKLSLTRLIEFRARELQETYYRSITPCYTLLESKLQPPNPKSQIPNPKSQPPSPFPHLLDNLFQHIPVLGVASLIPNLQRTALHKPKAIHPSPPLLTTPPQQNKLNQSRVLKIYNNQYLPCLAGTKVIYNS